MNKILITVCAALFVLCLFTVQMAIADSDQYVPSDAMEVGNDTLLFTAEELDELLAPIALYPDPLLAQSARIDDQSWDVSVKALAHYPDVLFMMDQKYDWSVSLGQAYVNQQQDVMDTIQRLRAEAETKGNLVSTSEQQVGDEGGLISIDPVEPDLIYVPQYDPLAVYVEGSSPGYGFITFGAGFTIGAWLNRDCDWHGRRIYYHGWQGGGWISRARPHIQIRNNVYINNSNSAVIINRKAIQHDTVRFREDIRRSVQLRHERSGHTAPPPIRVEQARPPSTGRRLPARPDSANVYRGRDIRSSQPVSQTGYGGYGSRRDAASYRERGQASRGNMQQITRPAPAQRPAVSGGKPVQSPSERQDPHQVPAGGERRQR